MKPDRLSRHLLIGFLLALALYAAMYWFIESRRIAQTPWVVGYEVDTSGRVRLEIKQISLGRGPVEIRFAAASTNAALPKTEVSFRKPQPLPRAMPVGSSIFEDLTFLPGTVVLKIEGSEIQMLPRALTIGTNEFSWPETHAIEIQADGSSRVIR